jgi:hypothetical protein
VSNQVIILKIGYNEWALTSKAGVAGKLLEILSQAVPVREDYHHEGRKSGETYFRIEARKAEVSVRLSESRFLLPPKPEDMESEGVLDINALPGVVKLLKGGR